ncbi:MAG: FtsX-like permease family protein [Bacteroidales bacterium]|nr:FtsX-like permease family protein [Bacteroidales bacterium]
MLAIKLAFKNLLGAGLRTWLNVIVLSFAFVLIIFYNGLIDGWNRQSRNDSQNWETGNGQFWHPAYDKYDSYTIVESHGIISDDIQSLIDENKLTPVLIRQATIYPQGRLQGAILKGVDPNQKILQLPTADIQNSQNKYAAIIGTGMARATKLKVGDNVLMRWRDNDGTFDAREIEIVSIFNCDVPSVDNRIVYMNLEVVQEMTSLQNEATMLVTNLDYENKVLEGWAYKDLTLLLKELDQIIESKKGSGMVLQSILLILALLAIFDTQVLSIFRRQKEIGTYIALGLTRARVVSIFTVEGAAHSILAAIVGAIYGIPLFIYMSKVGIYYGEMAKATGLPMAETLYPYYSVGLIISSIIIVVISATIVSYLPARKISKMNPTQALKGKIQ